MRKPKELRQNLLTSKQGTGTIAILAMLAFVAGLNAQTGTAVRELPYDFHPGDAVQVRLVVTPPAGTTNWTLQENFPNRWDFLYSTNASGTNLFDNVVTFGPFTNSDPRTLAYEVLSNPGYTNSVNFTGQVAFNFVTNLVLGTRHFPSRNEWLFDGPVTLDSQTLNSGLAYGAGRWVASSFGWITTIENGGRATYPRGLRLHADRASHLAYLNGLFLLFGTSPHSVPLMTVSDDGLSWVPSRGEQGVPYSDPFAAGSGGVRSVAYGNGVYVAAAFQHYPGETYFEGAMFRSTNGYHWRRVFRMGARDWAINAVAFTNGHFLAVAERGTLLVSTNGADWSKVQPIIEPASIWTNRNLVGICFGPVGWIVPTSDPTTVLRSFNGDAWSAINVAGAGAPTATPWPSFHADGKYWFPSGFSTYITEDGSVWSNSTAFGPDSPTTPIARAPDGVEPRYMGAGVNYSSLVSSSNGTNWSLALPGSPGVRWPRYLSAASLNGDFLISGQMQQPNGFSLHLYPTDRPPGIWTPYLQNSSLAARDSVGKWRTVPQHRILAYGDWLAASNGLLAVGANMGELRLDCLSGTNHSVGASAQLASLSRSVPGQYWKGGQLFGDYLHASITRTDSGYDVVAERYSGDPDSHRIRWGHFTSTDGSNWTRRVLGLNHATNFPGIRGLTWGIGRFVAVSEGRTPATLPDTGFITSPHRIYTSTDGEAYLPVDLSGLTPALSEGLTGVAFANGQFVAIGNQGRILCSTNGLDWETVRVSDSSRWNRIRYLDGVWAVVGNTNRVAFSLDGMNWHSRTAGAESDLTDIARQGDQFMLVGSHALVQLSQPVIPAEIVSSSVTKLPGAGLQFTVTGHPGRVVDIQASSDLTQWSRLLHLTNSTGSTVISDGEAAPLRFYRAVQQP